MAESGSGVKKFILIAIVAAVGFLLWMEGRWLLFDMRVGECMTAFPRFPTTKDVLDLKDKVVDQAKAVKIAPEQLTVELQMQKLELGGGSVGLHEERADKWWYLTIVTHWGRHNAFNRKRVENSICDNPADRKVLEDGGVKFLK
jgi:hypothetical protein